MEHLLNVYAAKAAAGSVAEFMGYIEVSEEEASTRLTPGLWLVRGGLASVAELCARLHHKRSMSKHGYSPAAALTAATPRHRRATRARPCRLRLFCRVCAHAYACMRASILHSSLCLVPGMPRLPATTVSRCLGLHQAA